MINVCFLELAKGALTFSDHVFIWHVIQRWSEGLIVTILLGMDLSADCMIASVMSLIFWSMLLVNCFFFVDVAFRKFESVFFEVC